MDLTWFAKFLNDTLKAIHPESHFEWNHKDKVIYPYLTYSFGYDPIDEIRDEFDVTINLFDYGTSKIKLLELESKLVNGLNRKYEELDKAFVSIRTGRGSDIPTGIETIRRRELQLTIKLDWKIQEENING